ncbi:TIGR01457 family HAD-type hydrolase [Aneurinibacillus sp. UBA3580]|jgi:4-nitrophenyl phosphatase|uniref:TIGR01457 family HAD-type hydrolase n=1 Tax=Aneurinibacillus sp. UBA3580 TaxID=1946041 RepID=UPI00258097F3|nr:TIGR01457 family HAD-type hydrolase [Aneurinibacillus sp. UBA3580]
MTERTYKGYLLDLDGTVYRGGEVIPEAVTFIETLKKRNIPYLYVTNNSSLTPEQLAGKLRKMGLDASPEDFFTSSMAVAETIEKMERQEETGGPVTVLAIGERGLKTALEGAGYSIVEKAPASYVVVGIDREFSYEKMKQATLAIYGGARFLSTNCDRAIPTEEGLVPGNGSLTASIAYATRTEPLYVGKPEETIIKLALERLGLRADEVLLIGDNLETDIAAGESSGVDTLLVYSGFSQESDVEKAAVKPTYTARSLADWNV